MKKESRMHNSRFAKAGVLYFYESEVLNSSFVHLMKFSVENPCLRKARTDGFFVFNIYLKFFYDSNSISSNMYCFNGDSDSFSVGSGHRNALEFGLMWYIIPDKRP